MNRATKMANVHHRRYIQASSTYAMLLYLSFRCACWGCGDLGVWGKGGGLWELWALWEQWEWGLSQLGHRGHGQSASSTRQARQVLRGCKHWHRCCFVLAGP